MSPLGIIGSVVKILLLGYKFNSTEIPHFQLYYRAREE